MRRLKYEDLLAIIDFLYLGEANVFQGNLDSFLAIADELQLNGLVGKVNENVVEVFDQKPIPPKVFNRDLKNSAFSETYSDRTVSVTYDFDGDEERLEKKVKSMMQIRDAIL